VRRLSGHVRQHQTMPRSEPCAKVTPAGGTPGFLTGRSKFRGNSRSPSKMKRRMMAAGSKFQPLHRPAIPSAVPHPMSSAGISKAGA
jgi:hypothetical protein